MQKRELRPEKRKEIWAISWRRESWTFDLYFQITIPVYYIKKSLHKRTEFKKTQNKPFSGAWVFLNLTIGPFIANFYGALSLWCPCGEFPFFFTVASMVTCYCNFLSENSDMTVSCACTCRVCGACFSLTSQSRDIILTLAHSVISLMAGRRIMETWRFGSWDTSAVPWVKPPLEISFGANFLIL